MLDNIIKFTKNVFNFVKNDKKKPSFFSKANIFICIIINKFLLQIRWKVKIAKNIHLSDYKKSRSGILFISNHTSNMDGNLIYWALAHQNCFISIWSHDFVFKLPYLGWAISTIGHVKVPNVSARRNFHDHQAVHKAIVRTVDGLKQGEHYLVFPAGSSKKTPREMIRGKSALHQILQVYPDVKIVLIRHKGMWGSRFSWAAKRNSKWKSEKDRWRSIIWDSVKMFLFNFIFFMPKREFVIEFSDLPLDFPKKGTRKEINQWLENYFNEGIPEEGETVNAVRDYFWKDEHIEYQCAVKEYHFNPSLIPNDIKRDVKQIIARRSGLPVQEIQNQDDLVLDIGLDSLEFTDVLIEIEQKFELPQQIPGRVSTVLHLAAIASKIPVVAALKEIPLKVEKQVYHAKRLVK